MPILRKKHDETTRSGEPLFIIYTPNEEFEGTRFKVRFFNGIGKTKSAIKAQMFSEQLGYDVSLHESVDKWKDAADGKKSAKAVYEEEDDSYFVDEEAEFEDDE